MSFKDKVVIVTGASTGIGAAIAPAFAQEGANTVLVARNIEKLQNIAKECENYGVKTLILKVDVSNSSEVATIVPKIIQKFGKIDILVNNAGILRFSSLEDGTFVEVFEEILATNLRPIISLTQMATPHLIATRGNVINISSIASQKLISHLYTAYGMLKSAMDQFTRGAAMELGKYGVRVNAVSPGPVKTDIFSLGGADISFEDTKITLLNRWGEPKDIADLVLFIASDKALSVTGSNYTADNGCLLTF